MTGFDTPLNLRYHVEPTEGEDDLVVYRTPNPPYALTAVRTPFILALVVYDYDHPDLAGYEIQYYTKDAVDNFETGGPLTWQFNADPYVVWDIDAATQDYHIKISKKVGGNVEIVYEYKYTTPSGNMLGKWELFVKDAQNTLIRKETQVLDHIGGTPPQIIRTHTVEQDGGLYSKVEDTLTAGHDWIDYALTKRVVDPSGAALTTEWTFELEAPPCQNCVSRGLLNRRTNPDGSQVAWDYDGAGRINLIVESWLDQTIGGELSVEDAHSYELVYEPVSGHFDPGDNFETLPLRPRMIVERVEGDIVGRTYHAYMMDGDDLVHVEKQCVEPVAANYSTGTNLTTTTIYDGEDEDRPLSIEYADDRIDVYLYQVGDYSVDGGAPVFTLDEEGEFERVCISSLSYTGAVPGKSTTSTIIRDIGHRVWAQELYDETYGGEPPEPDLEQRINWTRYQRDSRGRVTEVHQSNGTLTETEYGDGCCSPDVTVDATGIEMSYDRDLLGRPTLATKSATVDLPTEYGYAISSGLRQNTTTIGDNGTTGEELVTIQEYDLGGQIRYDTDVTGLVTAYAYDVASGGGREVTVTYPNGTTRITEYWRDGRVKQVTGTGVVHQFYTYGTGTVEDEPVLWTKVNIGSSQSPRYALTTYDAVGRVISEERAGFTDSDPVDVTTRYEYDLQGRLSATWTESDSSLLFGRTFYLYDGLSNRDYTIFDLDNDGTPESSGTDDRITRTQTLYQQDTNDDWWLETSTWVSDEGDNGAGALIGVQRQRLSGLAAGVIAESESQDILGNVTATTTELDRPNKTVTVTTEFPRSSGTAGSVSVNGLLTSSTTREGVATAFDYDALERRNEITDARNNVTTIQYEQAKGRIASITRDNPAGIDWVTEYGYYPNNDTSALRRGRLKYVENPAGDRTYYDYTHELGRVTHVWGAAAQPLSVEYDGTYGHVEKLHTYRGGSGWTTETEWSSITTGDADTTEWVYDEATGLVVTKIYEDATEVELGYTPDGRIVSRKWARYYSGNPLETTYGYDSVTGQLTDIDYADGTPDVEIAYDRLGRPDYVIDAVGQRDFGYDPESLLLTTEEFVDPPSGQAIYERLITREYEPYLEEQQGGGGPGGGGVNVTGNVAGRPAKLLVGIGGQSPDPDAYYSSEYSYDTATARLKTIKGPGLPAGGAVYNYNATSGLLEEIEFKSTSGTLLKTIREYEQYRNLVSEIRHRWSTTDTVSRYNYQHDDLGRRTSIVRNQKAFQQSPAAVHHDALDYNTRSELVETLRYDNATHGSTANPVTAKNRYYDYDNAANRDSHTLGQGSTPTTYETNVVNQYAATSQPSEAFDYDADGNLTEDGTFVYVWDAENRLIEVVLDPPNPAHSNGDQKLIFTYGYAGRRVRKVLVEWDSGDWDLQSPLLDRKFIYDGWQVVLELDGTDSDAIVRKFTWGLDLSGTLQGAGGVGGLLAVSTGVTDEDYLYTYDANGNVGQLVAWADDYGNASGTGWHIDRVVAHYEYDPYGAVVSASSYGSYLTDNPYRFSTKAFDDEMGLGYWGYRYYSPQLGRWMSRDPIGEIGGFNIYAMLRNAIADGVDPLGLDERAGEWNERLMRRIDCGRPCAIVTRMGQDENLAEFEERAARALLSATLGEGHVPVLDPGPAQDAVLATAEAILIVDSAVGGIQLIRYAVMKGGRIVAWLKALPECSSTRVVKISSACPNPSTGGNAIPMLGGVRPAGQAGAAASPALLRVAAKQGRDACCDSSGRILRKLTEQEKRAARKEGRKVWESVAGAPASARQLDVHHQIPLEWAHLFPDLNPNRVDNLVGVPRESHGRINSAWQEWKARLCGRSPTPAEVLDQASQIAQEFSEHFHRIP